MHRAEKTKKVTYGAPIPSLRLKSTPVGGPGGLIKPIRDGAPWRSPRRGPRRAAGGNRGFTLLEIVIVITLTAALVISIFEALDRVRDSEGRMQGLREDEKEVYILFNALSGLVKNISSYEVYNEREDSAYFLGSETGAVFLTRSPLMSPHGGIHFAELRFAEGQLLYRELLFSVPEDDMAATTFGAMGDTPFITLMDEVDGMAMQYFHWDPRRRQYRWNREINTFDRDTIPLTVSLEINYRGRIYPMSFDIIIKDKNEIIPPQLLQ